jgi:periplasmic protein TonB
VFSRLPESKPARQRRLGGAIVSTAVHLVFIALAVRATGLRADPAPETDPLPPTMFVAPVPEVAKPTVAPRNTSGFPTTPVLPLPPRPVLPNIAVIEAGIPVPGTEFDPTLWENKGLATGVSSSGRPDGAPNVAGGSPLPEHLVEKPVLAIPGTTTPRYPSMLQTAGVEGDVRAQFVVDTLGRVEQGSVRILGSTHELFASAVRDALTRARFKAAEAGGHKVRQLVEQDFTFRITK